MIWDQLEEKAAPCGLFLMGVLHDDGRTIALLGADASMWPVFSNSDELADGQPDPLDRWSKRHIGKIARQLGAETAYPSDGPPYAPFIAWAKASGTFWQSPTGMLIHASAGLMISIRGALIFDATLAFEGNDAQNPCESCEKKPCLATCPVDALSGDHPYEVAACKEFIVMEQGRNCLEAGCLVRRACPVSQSFGRDAKQSGFHMRAFVAG